MARMTPPLYLRDHANLYARDPRAAALDWFRQARFGLFLHYGLYSLLVGKWPSMTCRQIDPGTTRLYLHLWDEAPALLVEGLRNEPIQAMVLESGQGVKTESGKQGLWLELPKEMAGLSLPVIAVDLKGRLN
jgi:hypothetical protein